MAKQNAQRSSFHSLRSSYWLSYLSLFHWVSPIHCGFLWTLLPLVSFHFQPLMHIYQSGRCPARCKLRTTPVRSSLSLVADDHWKTTVQMPNHREHDARQTTKRSCCRLSLAMLTEAHLAAPSQRGSSSLVQVEWILLLHFFPAAWPRWVHSEVPVLLDLGLHPPAALLISGPCGEFHGDFRPPRRRRRLFSSFCGNSSRTTLSGCKRTGMHFQSGASRSTEISEISSVFPRACMVAFCQKSHGRWRSPQ